MPLVSNLFKDSTRLNACLTDHSAHVTRGAAGEHVHLIQVALIDLDQLTIDAGELQARNYGPSTAAAVLAYKRKRKIVNKSYQSSEDDIVGKMTIASLDKEMAARQVTPVPSGSKTCLQISPGKDVRPVRRFAGQA